MKLICQICKEEILNGQPVQRMPNTGGQFGHINCNTPELVMTKNAPLRCHVVDNQLVMSIGIETLVWASRTENGAPEEMEHGCPGYNCRVDGRRAQAWAKDVMQEIIEEDEIGNSPLNEFIDEMMSKAMENGSIAVNMKKIPKPVNPVS